MLVHELRNNVYYSRNREKFFNIKTIYERNIKPEIIQSSINGHECLKYEKHYKELAEFVENQRIIINFANSDGIVCKIFKNYIVFSW